MTTRAYPETWVKKQIILKGKLRDTDLLEKTISGAFFITSLCVPQILTRHWSRGSPPWPAPCQNYWRSCSFQSPAPPCFHWVTSAPPSSWSSILHWLSSMSIEPAGTRLTRWVEYISQLDEGKEVGAVACELLGAALRVGRFIPDPGPSFQAGVALINFPDHLVVVD